MSVKHFYEQKEYARRYVLPYLDENLHLFRHEELDALEIGCAEGGLVNEFASSGLYITGLELNGQRAYVAQERNKHATIFHGDITDKYLSVELINRLYDLVIMTDVIEHISNKYSAMNNVKRLLRYNGYLYLTFPTKQSPYAGRQQNLKSWLRYVPYLSYFTEKVIRFAGKLAKEKDHKIEAVIKNKHNAVYLTAFENMCQNMGFEIIDKNYYLSRPRFNIRYNLPIVKAFNRITTFGCEYLLQYRPIATD